MARPKKQTVDYFPHYCTHKKTMFIIEQKYGNDGYAFWFKILELLGSTEGHFLELKNGIDWEFLMAKTKLDREKCIEILNLLANLGTIDKELWNENNVVWSDNFIENIRDAYRNRVVEIPSKPSFLRKKSHNNKGNQRKKSTDEMKLNEMKLYNKIYSSDFKKESEPEPKVIADVFNYWNSKKIIVHRSLDKATKSKINKKLKDYSLDEIKDAIHNYWVILTGEEYFFKYKWTLKEFLQRGFEKFKDSEVADQNYRKDRK